MTVTVTDLACQLKLHRSRDEWRGACPSCGYTSSFVLSVGKGGRPIGWCSSCSDKGGIAQLLAEMQGGARHDVAADHHDADAAAKAARAFDRAMSLWHGSEPVQGTIAAVYLETRGIGHIAASAVLRYRPDCPHPSRCRLPALIALVQDADGGPLGIHRTFLQRGGRGKADIEPAKASLGPIRGGAVRIASLTDVTAAGELVVSEGVETAASAGHLLQRPAWAAISCGNLEHALQLPTLVRSVVIAADPDEPGRSAASAAWHRWNAEGRRVRVATPKNGDFNDILMRRMALGGTR